jgi:phosphatidylethanolamine-binding protein (PEBP) family uncharacterized protein
VTSSGGEETVAAGEFSITSADHADGAVFAPEATCEACGFDANKMVMPGLEWTAGPTGTMSYALVFLDMTLFAEDDPLGNHWAIWNIPAGTSTLPKSMKTADIPAGATQTGNFLGPCPSFGGTATHNYAFTLYAMPTATVDVSTQGQATAVVGNAVTLFEANALAKVELTGTSSAAAGQGGASCN